MASGDSALLLQLQTEVLEAVAYGHPLATIVEILCHHAEVLAPEVMCSILTVDAAGLLHPLAAPSLPAELSASVEGLAIGPAWAPVAPQLSSMNRSW